jgi:hypothetical protein
MLRDLYLKAMRLQVAFLHAWAPPPPQPIAPLDQPSEHHGNGISVQADKRAQEETDARAARDYANWARSRGLPEQMPREIYEGTRLHRLSEQEQEILTHPSSRVPVSP